jgi:putative endonuclease
MKTGDIIRGKSALGSRGEDEVCRYLAARGHTILERNWRCGHLEVDIISIAPDGIHFAEVKSRTVPIQGEPEEAVNAAKQRHLAAAAGKYLKRKKKLLGEGLEVWFDVAAVTFDGSDVEIRYHTGAFIPIYC